MSGSDIAETFAAVQRRREQVAGQDPLHRLIGAHLKRHPDRVRIRAVVRQPGGQRDDRAFRPDQAQAQLGRNLKTIAAHHLPFPSPSPATRNDQIMLA